jgi:hypothetical protein
MRYVGSFDQEPLYYIQTILAHVRQGAPDPQTNLHADTFHPTVKAWLFLTDVAADEGPFVFVPGSHLMTDKRLAWEQEMSIRAGENSDRYSARGSFRIRPDELARLGLGEPRAFAVPANTLVVADTVGFHARGLSLRASKRVEIWAYGRRNPFLPWTGLDPLSLREDSPLRHLSPSTDAQLVYKGRRIPSEICVEEIPSCQFASRSTDLAASAATC